MICGTPLAGAAGIEERKVVTVLFTDLVGFTSRSERMDVEEVRGTLAPYHQLVRRELERHGGTVEKFIGDAVMAVFGAPVAHEDDPERAVRAGLAVQAAVAELRERGGPDLHVRIGINTGEALVTVSAGSATEGIASGDVVNTAARLQTAAPVDGVLVGEPTYRATQRAIEYAPCPPIDAKGKADPVAAWIATAPRARFGTDVVQNARAPLVGRERQLRLLMDALEQAVDERSTQLATLVGVPGIGKSRLVWELFRHVDERSDTISWRQGRSLPYGDGVTFWALNEMLKAQAGILHSDPPEAMRAKLSAAVAGVLEGTEAAWAERHLQALIGVGASGGELQESFAAWRRFLEAVAEERPLVLVFEDLHWADDQLLEFVEHLVGWASDVPLLVLCTARPEFLERRPGWGGGRTNSITVALAPLSETDTARLVGALLNQAVLPAETQAALVARAAGNPLYAEEYIRMLVDRGFLRREGGGPWRPRDAQELPLPETVQGIISARLDALAPQEKRLLQNASVLGKVGWLGAIAALSDLDRAEAEQALHRLERKEFLRRERRASIAGEVEYAFRHVLVRDVAYGQIPRPGRADKHRRAAAWIETLSEDRRDRADMLAYHYATALDYARAAGGDAGELVARTREALHEAGDRAEALNAHESAARFYRRALELSPPGTPGRGQLLLRHARMKLDLQQLQDDLAEARDLLLAEGDRAGAAEAEAQLTWGAWNDGRVEEVLAHQARALELLEGLPPSRERGHVLSSISISRMLAGDLQGCIEIAEELMQLADELGAEEVRVEALVSLGTARAIDGNIDGLEDMRRAAALAEAIGAASGLTRALKNLNSTLVELGRLDEAAPVLQRAVEHATRLGDDFHVGWFEVERMVALSIAGDWDEAWAIGEWFDRRLASGGSHYMEEQCRETRARITFGRGDRELALHEAARALELGRRGGDLQVIIPALSLNAHLASECGDVGGARRLVAEVGHALKGRHIGALWTIELAFTGRTLGWRVVPGEPAISTNTPWWRAAQAVEAEDPIAAAEICAAMGARSHAAYARLRAAEALAEHGRSAEAAEQARLAAAAFAGLGASAYLERCAALEAASA
jgi:predicted ATPase/class 3 adenylate cyclase